MSSPVVSLLDAQPTLVRALGRLASAELGHRRVLPLLRLSAGSQALPGDGAIAFVVVDGLLCCDAGEMAGPGDVVATPEGGWTACTSVHVAIVGPAFVALAASWPGAATGLVGADQRRLVEPATGGALDERVLELLWRLAGFWGAPDGAGMTLPLAVRPEGLARLTGCTLDDVVTAVGVLADSGAASARHGGGWRLAGAELNEGAAYSRGRRDELRARGAQQRALARQAVSDYAELSDRLATEVRRSRRRRAQG